MITKKQERITRCKNCLHWDAIGIDRFSEEKKGICRRLPPKVLKEYEDAYTHEIITQTVWPETIEDEWCGRAVRK